MSRPERQPAAKQLTTVLAFTLLLPFAVAAAERSSDPGPASESLQGKVVWLASSMKRLHDAQAVAEARERILALETPEGELYTILEDARGRAFRKDERLRNRDVELLVRRFPGTRVVQVIEVYARNEGRRFEVDYWCEVCSIAMFEAGLCECCQQPNELRLREQ